MKLYEELKDQDAKDKYRELSKKYHPDIGGDIEIMKKVTDAKDKGDIAMRQLYSKLIKKKVKEKVKEEKPYVDQMLKDAYKKFDKWAYEIEQELGKGIVIILDIQNNKINGWINHSYGKERLYIYDVVSKFKSKEEFMDFVEKKVS